MSYNWKNNVRRKGGGRKLLNRIINFIRTHWDSIPGIVELIEYDPSRLALIAFVRHKRSVGPYQGKVRPDRYAYIICPAGL